jgi:hypothetical protein
VDGLAQATRWGPFLWAHAYASRLALPSVDGAPAGGGPIVLEATTEAYRRIGVVHRRRIALAPSEGLTVEDALEGRGAHALRLSWPLGPEIVPLAELGRVALPGGRVARFSIDGLAGRFRLEMGDVGLVGTPCVSEGYDRLRAASAFIAEGVQELPCRVVTHIRLENAPPAGR